jgi:molybdopterin biosynthesis enzyme
MTLSGNVAAIAQLSNTVTATSVTGSSVATATSNAVGLNNYDVTIISGGSVTGRADALSRAVASDTTGSATATATL